MDTKVIVEKALKGEDYSKDIEAFTDEQKISLNREIATESDKAAKVALEKVTGLRKAAQAVEAKTDAAFGEKFAKEQRSIAKEKFFSDPKYALTDAEKAEVEAEFIRRGSESYNVDNLISEYKKAYGAVKADSLISGQEKAREFQKNAEQFNASMANGGGTISQADADKYSPEAKELFKEFQKAGFKNRTLDDAQKLINKGADWRKSDLTQ